MGHQKCKENMKKNECFQIYSHKWQINYIPTMIIFIQYFCRNELLLGTQFSQHLILIGKVTELDWTDWRPGPHWPDAHTCIFLSQLDWGKPQLERSEYLNYLICMNFTLTIPTLKSCKNNLNICLIYILPRNTRNQTPREEKTVLCI